MGDNGGWQLVSRKKQHHQSNYNNKNHRRMDIAGKGWHWSKERTVSFYFSEFPDSHGAKEMLRAFAMYGKVVEVFVPLKRNKRGRIFGFVRFADVQDPRLFAVKLDNIIFGATKIHVNVPRFEREYEASNMKQGRRQINSIIQQKGSRKVWREVIDGREAVKARKEEPEPAKGNNGTGDGGKEKKGRNNKMMRNMSTKWIEKSAKTEQKIVYFRKKSLCDVWYEASKEEMNQHKKKYIGVLKNSGGAHIV